MIQDVLFTLDRAIPDVFYVVAMVLCILGAVFGDRKRTMEDNGTCTECGREPDDEEYGRDDECSTCFIDPTPQERWEVTTPAAAYSTGRESEEWKP